MNMNFDKSDEPAGALNLPQLNFHKAFRDLPWRCSALTHLPLFDPNPSSFKTHLQNAISTLQSHAKHALDVGMTNLYLNSPSSVSQRNNQTWARISEGNWGFRRPVSAMSTEAIEERLAGIPVYALSNDAEEFVLVSGASTGKNLSLLCIKKEDAEALLEQVKSVDPQMREGSKVVPVALNKVFQLKVNGVAFRLIPEYSQVKNALGVSDLFQYLN